jgi:hypothetical protein
MKAMLAINVAFALVLGIAVWMSYQQHLHYIEERATNTTLALERSISGMMDQLDLVLNSGSFEKRVGYAA